MEETRDPMSGTTHPSPHVWPPRFCPHPGRGPKTSGAVSPPSDAAWPVDTSPGFWWCLEYPVCQACTPVASPLPPHLSLGKEDVLPLPVSCRLCGGAGAHLPSTVRSSPVPLLLSAPRGQWRQVLIPPPWPPSPAPAFPRYPFCHPFKRTESAQPGC